MGGIDKDNLTLLALKSIEDSAKFLKFIIVLGSTSGHIKELNTHIAKTELNCEIHIDSTSMADLMMETDLAIAACGTSAFERCVMGLPMLNFIVAENQRKNADILQSIGASKTVWDYKAPENIAGISSALNELIKNQEKLSEMSLNASEVTAGEGVNLIIDKMYQLS